MSIVITAIYLYLGTYVLRSNPRERLNQLFFLTCICLAFWSFGYTFLPGAPTKDQAWFWFKFSALGWTLGPALVAHFLYLLACKELPTRKRWSYLVLYMPAFVFLVEAWTGNLGVVDFVNTRFGWLDVYGPLTPMFAAYLVYFPLYLLGGLGLVYAKGRDSELVAVRKQSRLIAYSGLPILAIVVLNGIALPWMRVRTLPEVSHLIVPIWILAVWQALSTYSPMTLTPAVAGRDILKTLADAVVLLSRDQTIVGVNDAAERIFSRPQQDLLGQSIVELLHDKDPGAGSSLDSLLSTEEADGIELLFRGEAGEQIPVSLSVTRVLDEFD